jgi:hypothetical protein
VKQDITIESTALKKVKCGLYFSLLGCIAFIVLSLFILFNVPGFQGLLVGLLGTVTFGTFLFLGLQALWCGPTVPKHEGFLPDPKSPSWAETVFSVVISVVTAVLFGIIERHLPRLPNLDFLGIAAHLVHCFGLLWLQPVLALSEPQFWSQEGSRRRKCYPLKQRKSKIVCLSSQFFK